MFSKLQDFKSIKDYYRVLQSLTESYGVLQSITEYYRVLKSITEYYRVLQSITEYNRVLQSITEYHRVLQSITEYYRVQQSFTKYYTDKTSAPTWTNFFACLYRKNLLQSSCGQELLQHYVIFTYLFDQEGQHLEEHSKFDNNKTTVPGVFRGQQIID